MIKLLEEIGLSETGLLPALVNDYLKNAGNIRHLYKYPFSLENFAQVIRDKSQESINRKLLIEVLTEQYRNIPTSEKVKENINSLGNAQTFTVTASHQPCLFLGPLYNIYKTAAVISLAKILKQKLPDYHFVPVFWLGSEDHDIEELNHTFVDGKRLEWKNPGTGAVGRLKIDSMQALVPVLKEAGVGEEVIKQMQVGLSACQTFGELSRYLLDFLFRERGLVIVDQDNKEFKQAFKDIIADDIVHQRAPALLQANIDFLDANYKAQAKPREINFFYLGEGFRERVVFNADKGDYEVNNTALSFTKEQMLAEIDHHPENFSPNVIFRPLYQERILPNLAFTGGSGELSYWLELKPLFEQYKINFPMLVLRPMAAIMTNSAVRKLGKLNLKAGQFLGDVEQLINYYVQANLQDGELLKEEKEQINRIFDSIAQKASEADTSLGQSAAAEKQKAIAAADNIASKIFKAEKRKQETAVNQIRSIHAELFPDGVLQERHEGFMRFYDSRFIADVVDNSDVFNPVFRFFLNE